jgi:integrase
MGSIRVRPESGCLFIDFRYRAERCRELTALPDTPANRKRLQKLLDRIEAEIAAGTFDYRRYFPNSKQIAKLEQTPMAQAVQALTAVVNDQEVPIASASSFQAQQAVLAGTPLFKDFAETWYSEKEIEWRRSHKTIIRDDLDKLLIPQFGEMRVGQIAKADVLAFRASLAKVPARKKTTPLSNARINKIMNPLRQILNEAADRYDFRTAFGKIKQLKVPRSDVQPFTLDEVKLLIETIRPDFKNYLRVRFFTGMRTGEVHGLQWKYVDFERRLILIRETIVDGEDDYTKNDYSQREIQMNQVVHDALMEQRRATGHLKYVFCSRSGEPLENRNFVNRVWRPLLRHLQLPHRRPYQCRHTAATLWLAAGEAPEWIARQMGHSTTEMLFRVYSRFVPNLTRNDGSAFERLLRQSGALQVVASTAPAANDAIGAGAANDSGATPRRKAGAAKEGEVRHG